jgi:phenylacetate-CoA ligase
MKECPNHLGFKSRREILQQQAVLLRRYLDRTVIPFSKYYRDFAEELRRVRSVDDLSHIPLTTKRDLQEHPLDFVIVPEKKILARRPSTIVRAMWCGRRAVEDSFEREFRPVFMTFTSGRSSEPLPVVYSNHDLDNLKTAGVQIMNICGAKREMRMVNMFPYAPHLAFWQSHYAGTEFGVFMVVGTEGNLRLLQRINPDAVIGMPTFLYHVMQEAVSRGLKCARLQRIILGGEKVPEGMCRKLKALAAQLGAGKVDVLMTYGFTEAKMAWPECPHPDGAESGGFHLYPELNLIEVVDPKTGEPVGEGEPGEIVYTPLDSRGTVVLRYRTGDMIEGGLVHEPCPHCGRCVPRLIGHISRTAEVKEMQLDKLKGTLVDFNQLEHVLDGVDSIGTWQLELRKAHDDPLDLDELVLHVEKSNGADESRLRLELDNKVASAVEVHPNKIVFESAEDMRRLQGVNLQIKEQRIVDHRPKPQNGNGVHTNGGSH